MTNYHFKYKLIQLENLKMLCGTVKKKLKVNFQSQIFVN